MKRMIGVAFYSLLICGCSTSDDRQNQIQIEGQPKLSEETDLEADQTDATRDPKLWPFTKSSIWNMPIGSNAVYKNANFEAADHVGVDTQHIIVTQEGDPYYDVLESPTFEPGRCSGIEDLGFDLPFPADLVIPDAGNSPYGNTPNSNFALIFPDGDSVLQSSQISRCSADGPIYLPSWMQYPDNRKITSIRLGDGVENSSGQGASGMSSLGGTIRVGELTGKQPLRHAVKINPWAKKYVFYSDDSPGYRWPAVKADSYAASEYNRNGDPDILMGSLFAIPKGTTAENLGVASEAGKILFNALQNYGMYFVEDAAWDTWDIILEAGAATEFESQYGFSLQGDEWKNELNALMQALHIVTNNAPESIGGGGEPLMPLAPDFKD